MHAFLVIGGSDTDREHVINDKISGWQTADFDRVIAGGEDGSIGIADIRAFIQRLNLSPQYSELSVGIIRGGHRLTTEAQQALLKTLEEPPPHARIIIESAVIGNLLATVVSRCAVEKLADTDTLTPERTAQVTDILSQAAGQPGQTVALSDAVTGSREDAAAFVRDALRVLHGLLLTAYGINGDGTRPVFPGPVVTGFIRRFLTAEQQLDVNVTPGLVIDRALS